MNPANNLESMRLFGEHEEKVPSQDQARLPQVSDRNAASQWSIGVSPRVGSQRPFQCISISERELHDRNPIA